MSVIELPKEVVAMLPKDSLTLKLVKDQDLFGIRENISKLVKQRMGANIEKCQMTLQANGDVLSALKG